MAFTLSNMLVALYTELGQLSVLPATGGTTTTVVDSKRANSVTDDTYNEWTMFIIRDAGGSAAAPEGEFNRISDYTGSSGTFTVDTAFTAAPASGDTYGIANTFFPLHDMIRVCNEALLALGDVPLVDTTTLTGIASQTEYAAAVAWKRRPPYRVDIQGRTDDANDNKWQTINDWEYVPAAAGSTGLIVLPLQPLVSYDLRVWYKDRHGILASFSDAVNETLDPALVTAMAVERALTWQNTRLQGSDEFLLQRWNDAKQTLAELEGERQPWKPKRKPKLLIVGASEPEEDDFTTPAAA